MDLRYPPMQHQADGRCPMALPADAWIDLGPHSLQQHRPTRVSYNGLAPCTSEVKLADSEGPSGPMVHQTATKIEGGKNNSVFGVFPVVFLCANLPERDCSGET